MQDLPMMSRDTEDWLLCCTVVWSCLPLGTPLTGTKWPLRRRKRNPRSMWLLSQSKQNHAGKRMGLELQNNWKLNHDLGWHELESSLSIIELLKSWGAWNDLQERDFSQFGSHWSCWSSLVCPLAICLRKSGKKGEKSASWRSRRQKRPAFSSEMYETVALELTVPWHVMTIG